MARNAVAGDGFKPIQAEFGLAAKAAFDYTRTPEVTHAEWRSRAASGARRRAFRR
jgi:hypothetical protein